MELNYKIMPHWPSFAWLVECSLDDAKIWVSTTENGLRCKINGQVYYTDVGITGELWCASQPGHIAKACSLKMNQKVVDFIKCFQNRTDESW